MNKFGVLMENLVDEFLDRLKQRGMEPSDSPGESFGENKQGRVANLYEVKSPKMAVVMHVKGSTSEKGFWGMSVDAADFLIAVDEEYEFKKCSLVLLHKNTDTAYVLSAQEIKRLIADKNIANDNQYKINEGELIGRYSKLTSFDSILVKLGL